MKANRALLAVAVLLPGGHAWGLNFTPRAETQMIDTYAIHYLSFEDGAQRVEYGPPTGWKVVGTAAQLTLEDPQNSQAQAIFTVLPMDKAEAFTNGTLQKFKAAAAALIPADSQNVTTDEAAGQAPMGNKEAYSISHTYAYFGRKLCLRVVFVNLGKSILQIVCTAPEDQFSKFVASLDSSLYSWHWTDSH